MKGLIICTLFMSCLLILTVAYQRNKPATTYSLNAVQECAEKISDKQIRLSFLNPLKLNPSEGDVTKLNEKCEEALQKQNLNLAINSAS